MFNSRVVFNRCAAGLLGPGIALILMHSATVHAEGMCTVAPPPALDCIGSCPDPLQQCVPIEILADSDGNFIAITCCDCTPHECHVDYDPIQDLIFCAKDCPVPPPGETCTLLAKGNLDGTITYACECIHPADPHICEPVSECDPCLPGSCTLRCPGPCPDVNDPCLPTVITEFPQGTFTLTGCDCDPVCRPILNSLGVVECIDQCLDGVTQCPLPVITLNPAGGDDYTCPPCTPQANVCPEPTNQTLCEDAGLQDAECVSDDPLTCLPTCIFIDDMGVITALSCECATLELCHVDLSGPAPFCDGFCLPGETCVETIVDDGAGGQTFCCECLPCGPDPTSPTGCLDVICPNPHDICVPTCFNDDGTGIFTAIDCDCRSAEECYAVITPPPASIECVNLCPDGTVCVRNETPDGMGGTYICCACERECGPGDCCAGRPDLKGYPAGLFTGRVAVVTASPSVLGGYVVTIYDMSKGVLDSAPFNSDFPIGRYNALSWDEFTLGSVFGITLDPAGNIYVTASTSYTVDVQGLCPGWGGVYQINGMTGLVTCFADLPNTGTPEPGLGNISYDCEHDQFFVTNFNDGKIYRLDTSGTVLSTFDHGTAYNGAPGFAPLGERLWGVEAHRGRVYYSVWSQDIGRPVGAGPNEIWSVPLDSNGEFTTGVSLEVTLPQLVGFQFSNPVSDIRFTPKLGRMLLAERGMNDDTTPEAHRARVLEYVCMDTVWLPSPNTFKIGPSVSGHNCAGGVDIDYKPDGPVWATGDLLHLSPQLIYGIQGLPATGGDVTTSYLIDYNGNLIDQDKTEIGDVVVSCPGCVEPPGDMVAWWPFDEVGGPIAVDIIDSHHGAHKNMPTPEPAGFVDGALRFDGLNDFVEVPHATTLDFLGTGAFSVDLWVHHDAPSGGLVGKLDPTLFPGFEFFLDGGVPTLFMQTTQISCEPTATSFGLLPGWHHLAATVTDCPRMVTLYVDGQVAATGTSGCCDIGNTVPLVIGSDALFTLHFEGVIDEVELFDRVLSSGEIEDIYQAGSNGKCKGCRPKPDLSNCLPFSCPGQFDNCLARHVIYDPNTGQTVVLRCDCGLPNLWHYEDDAVFGPGCYGDCPVDFTCEEIIVENPDGTLDIQCTIELLIPVPTVSQWGMIVMTLLVLTCGTVVLRSRLGSPWLTVTRARALSTRTP